MITAIFNLFAVSSIEAIKSKNTSDLSILDTIIPVEGNLISIIKELVIKELSPVIYKPNDEVNNSADDLNKMGVK